MAKNKFYVVWKGLNPGIYDNWAECKAQVDGQEGAKYKSFENREEAAKAFEAGYTHYLKTASSPKAVARLAPEAPIGNPINESLAVDAACSGNPGDMEYRGVYTATGQEIFHIGPLKEGTNNVGEFLALVHGLALLQQKGSDLPIYSDSRNAISWEDKFALDVWYVENQSFWLDVKILFLTVKKVLVKDGISASGEATMTKFTGSKN